jgi:hypothetical protein
MFELSLLHELAAGRHDPLQVGEVPQRVCRFLGCKLPFVYLSKYTFAKIMKKHSDVSFFDLLILPLALRNGRYVEDRPRSVAITYRYPDTGKEYLCAIKCTHDECELWLVTFHRIDKRKSESVRRRGKLIIGF